MSIIALQTKKMRKKFSVSKRIIRTSTRVSRRKYNFGKRNRIQKRRRLFEISSLKSRSAWVENETEKARKQRNENSKRLIKSVILGNADIFVVRKSYNTQKAQDIAYLVLFVLLYLVFLLSDKIFKINNCILALFRKTGLELTSYPFCLIRRPQNVFLRGQVFKFSLFYCYERR